MQQKGTVISWATIGVFLVTILFLLAIIGPGYKSGAIHAWRRACYANIRIIGAQVEMHLLDGGTASSVIAPDQTIILPPTLRPPAVAKSPVCMAGGSYKMGGTGSDTYIYCTFHGDEMEGGPEPGRLDPEYSMAWWLFRWFQGIFR